MNVNVDAITLAAVADEWCVLLRNARIDTIIQPTEHALALQCYAPGTGTQSENGPGSEGGQGGRNRWLYLSAHPQFARAHITALKPPKIASEPPPFVMLLRKYLEGARIESIQQPRWERVVEIIAGHRASPDSDERVRYRLIIEIMGRVSNIIFCDESGMILGSLKRVGADVNRYRIIAANVPYVPPPPQQRTFAGQMVPKLEPTTITSEQLALCAADDISAVQAAEPETSRSKKKRSKPQDTMLWQVLPKHLLGVSPLMAHEAVYRTTGDTETLIAQDGSVLEELAWNMRELSALYDTHRWQPQLVERVNTGAEQANAQQLPLAFAPYVLEQYVEMPGVTIRQSPSMNVILDDYYARVEWRDAMEGVRSPMRKILQTQRDRTIRKAELLQNEMAQTEEAARYRLHAELLLANQNDIQQGQTTVTLPNFYANAEDRIPDVTMSLDPRFDAVGNANRLFNKYHKLRRATALVPDQIAQNEVERATIEQLLADLMLAENPAEVALVRAEVQAAGYMRGGAKLQDKKALKAAKKGKGGKGGKQTKGKSAPPGGGVPLHVRSRDGFTLLIGKNSRQNEEVTFNQATSNDIWLHARGVPGAHVIIKAAGRDIPRATIEQAASLAAYYSQARGSTTAPVDYTFQRHVRHMKGGGPGMVIYDHERTLYAVPEGGQ